jgi:hypothetical protein
VRYSFTEPIWEHEGPAAWYFITLPHDVTDEIDELTEGRQRGFGSVRVQVTVGATTWATSIFPDTRAGSFVLPVKKAVRATEGLESGEAVDVLLELIDPV